MTKVVQVPVEVTVQVDERLTQKGELAAPNVEDMARMSGAEKLVYTTQLYHVNTGLAIQCYAQLDEIRALP